MRKRTFWQRARSNDAREGMGPSRFAALWRQFNYRRLRYRHSEREVSRRWDAALRCLNPPKRRVLRQADPRPFFQSPGLARLEGEREGE